MWPSVPAERWRHGSTRWVVGNPLAAFPHPPGASTARATIPGTTAFSHAGDPAMSWGTWVPSQHPYPNAAPWHCLSKRSHESGSSTTQPMARR